MTDIYSVVEDGEETFMGVLIPRDKNVLYRSIIKHIRLYTHGYTQMAIKNKSDIPIAVWKLREYNRMIDDLVSIVGINKDTKDLYVFIKNLQSSIN